ncbi:hypothetical protein NQ318_014055 [Aromia moschata]|uniref:Transposase Tc1-like domain-containing protein n=1 Tax=Aromia moschata TaxID=1265417 RepID=A0AAV8YYF6_9CUCU|nr:hypothetical protein NQ318_014055 [Aromia moschata]
MHLKYPSGHGLRWVPPLNDARNVACAVGHFLTNDQGEQRRLQRTIRQGIGKVSTENEDNALVEFINHNPFEPAVKAREETSFPGSLRTTQRRLKQCGFKNCVAAHKMFLTEEHKQRRVQFANEFLQGNEFWNNVMFSDEKTFQSSKNERLHVYRSRNTRFEENYTLSTTNSGRFSVNVWAWISVHDPGVCWQIDGRLTSAHYTYILENVMLPSGTVASIYTRPTLELGPDSAPCPKDAPVECTRKMRHNSSESREQGVVAGSRYR